MATVPELHVVHVPLRDGDVTTDAIGLGDTVRAWAPVEVPRGQRPSSIVLAVLGVLAGIGAMALGTVAVISAGTSPSDDTSAAASQSSATPGVEERALSLLAKPSTERIVFRGSEGRLVLAVGTGGRAAILLRGLEPASALKPYYAWVLPHGVVGPGSKPVRAARFLGTERAAFLSVRLGPRAEVVVSSDRPVAGRTGRSSLVASR